MFEGNACDCIQMYETALQECWAALLLDISWESGLQWRCGIKITESRFSSSLNSLVSFKKAANYFCFSLVICKADMISIHFTRVFWGLMKKNI